MKKDLKDLLLLSKILKLSVVWHQVEELQNKPAHYSSESELHARDRYAVADKITEEFHKEP